MKSFKEFKLFLKEQTVSASKRQNMMHLQKMPDIQFIEFIKDLQKETGAKLKGIDISLKVDGGGARFGISEDGKPFFEGSRTGPIFEPKAFSSYAIGKGSKPEVVARAYHYDDMWDIITKSKFIKTLPRDSKVICEVFYNPMGEIVDSGIKFVSIVYDKSKVGTVLTIIPFEVVYASSGEKHPQSESIINDLIKQSTKEIKILSPKLDLKGSINLSGMIDPILSMGDDTIATLKSRKRADAPMKEMIRSIIQRVKDKIADKILDDPNIIGKDMLGPDIEGLVLNISGKQVKVTTPQFKLSKKK